MVDDLDKLEEWFRRLGRDHLIERLQPGLERDVIGDKMQRVGLATPDDLYTLYEWHDGTKVGVGEVLDDFHFFPGFYFVSLEDALITFTTFRKDRRWNPRWLPVFANGGGDFYVVDCSSVKQSPVIGFMIDQSDQPVEYSSLQTMMGTLVEAFDKAVFFVEEDGYLQADDAGLIPIAQRHNPDLELWRS